LTEPPSRAIEVIAIGDRLYRRLPRETIRNGKVGRGAYYFRGEPDPSASVDLARLTRPEATRLRAPRPERLGVGELLASVPLGLGLTVRHDPTVENPAHCLIEGQTSRAICQTLADHTTVIIFPPEEQT
jgi:hypothetical protein